MNFLYVTSIVIILLLKNGAKTSPTNCNFSLNETICEYSSLTEISNGIPSNITHLTLPLELLLDPSGVFKSLYSLRSLRLRSSTITEIPSNTFNSLTSLTELYLSFTQISSLQSETFESLASLKTLDLSSNKLTSLHPDLFKSLTSLTTLKLFDNQILSLPPDLFKSLTSLNTLFLFNNQISSLPPDVFKSLTSLSTLSLFHNKIFSLPPDVFKSLSNLSTLDLSANQLSSLPPEIFNSLTSLSILNLFHNQISSLTPDVFKSLTSLSTLYLSDNQISNLPPDVFKSLTSLSELSLFSNHISSLPPDVFKSLTSLRTLHLFENQISDLPPDVFKSLTHLNTLNLFHNQISRLPPDVFKCLTNLGILDLSDNQISSLPPDVFKSLTSLSILKLFHNQISILPPDVFKSLTSLSTLDLSDNQLSSLPSEIFSSLTSLSILNLFYNQISSLPPDVFKSLSNLNILYLSGNQISSLPPVVFKSLTNLSDLSLFNNHISSLPSDVFKSLTSLNTLYLFGNQISSLPPDVFKSLTNLRTLYLSDNQISDLPPDVFKSLTSLSYLYLHNNQLSNLPSDVFNSLTSLTSLDLFSNKISGLPSDVFQSTTLNVLNIDNNPMNCDCNLTTAIKLLQVRTISIFGKCFDETTRNFIALGQLTETVFYKDMCNILQYNCSAIANFVNLNGSYTCICKNGYQTKLGFFETLSKLCEVSTRPIFISVKNEEKQKLNLQWKIPESSSSAILGYIICYQQLYLDGLLVEADKICKETGNVTAYNITNLGKYNSYTIQLTAKNSHGQSALAVFLAFTQQDVPTNVQNVDSLSVSKETSIIVKWDAPLNVYGILRGYTVYYKKELYSTSFITQCYQTKNETCLIDNLSPYTNYTIKVLVENGVESNSVSFQIATCSSVPPNFTDSLPTVETNKITANTFTINLVHFSETNGPIRDYHVVVKKLDSPNLPPSSPASYSIEDIQRNLDGIYLAGIISDRSQKTFLVGSDSITKRKRREAQFTAKDVRNPSLFPETYYTVFLRGYVSDSVYQTTGYYNPVKTAKNPTNNKFSITIGTAVGVSILILLFIGAAVYCIPQYEFILRKRRKGEIPNS